MTEEELRRTLETDPTLEPGPEETLDRLSERLWLLQRRHGHRAASDDGLLAWAGARARPAAERVLDLGSGKGTAALLLLQRCLRCRVVGVEAVAESHALARRNARLNQLEDRYQPLLGDLREPAVLAGQPPFQLVTGAPPFKPSGSGVLPRDPARAAARFELRGGVEEYAAAAARHLAPDGAAVLLMDGLAASRARAEAALAAEGLRVRRVLAVHPCPERPPTYWIFEADSGPERAIEEVRLSLRVALGAEWSPEYLEIRRELELP